MSVCSSVKPFVLVAANVTLTLPHLNLVNYQTWWV